MATGVIVVSKLVGKSVLTQLYSTYPIRFMQQETWSNFVHIQMLGFGGGLVSGDNYTVQIKLNSGANLR